MADGGGGALRGRGWADGGGGARRGRRRRGAARADGSEVVARPGPSTAWRGWRSERGAGWAGAAGGGEWVRWWCGEGVERGRERSSECVRWARARVDREEKEGKAHLRG